jgi:ABC-type Fe3+/spermidine/putrescine transport system ATPase subunit
METGKVAQVGTPVDVYEEPADAYVADFLGVSNLMEAHADGQDAGGACRIRLGEFDLSAERGMTGCTGAVKVAIRPERVQIEPYESSGLNRVPAMVERLVFLGSSTQILLRLAHGVQVQALMQNEGGPPSYQQGNAVQAYLPADALRVLRGSAVAYSEDTMGAPETEPSVSVAGPLST